MQQQTEQSPKGKKDIKEEKEMKEKKEEVSTQAEQDIDFLDNKLPTLDKEEQKRLLATLRTTYGLKPASNVSQLKKTIQKTIEK